MPRVRSVVLKTPMSKGMLARAECQPLPDVPLTVTGNRPATVPPSAHGDGMPRVVIEARGDATNPKERGTEPCHVHSFNQSSVDAPRARAVAPAPAQSRGYSIFTSPNSHSTTPSRAGRLPLSPAEHAAYNQDSLLDHLPVTDLTNIVMTYLSLQVLPLPPPPKRKCRKQYVAVSCLAFWLLVLGSILVSLPFAISHFHAPHK